MGRELDAAAVDVQELVFENGRPVRRARQLLPADQDEEDTDDV